MVSCAGCYACFSCPVGSGARAYTVRSRWDEVGTQSWEEAWTPWGTFLADFGKTTSALAAKRSGYSPWATHQAWQRDVYPLLEEEARPLECVQEAGWVLYLPEGWYHATENQNLTLSLARQPLLPART